jgi:hypothetical protein
LVTDALTFETNYSGMNIRAAESGTTSLWYVGGVSLIGAPLLLVVYLALYHGVDVGSGIRAVVALYFLGIVPGYVVQRFVFRIRPATRFEALLSSLLVGVLLAPVLWYLLCSVGLAAVFAPFMLGLGLIVPIACRWHRQAGLRARQLVPLADAPILWLAAFMAIIWSLQPSLFETRSGQVYVVPHSEHCQHATIIIELARGVPQTAVPSLASARNWGYHYLPDVWADMMRRASGVDPIAAYFHIALPFRYVLITLACYLMLVGRFGRLAAFAGAVCLLSFVEPMRFTFPKSWLSYLHYSYPTSFGLIATFLVVYYASTAQRTNPRGPLLLASLLSGLMLWYKANFALAVGPAVFLLSVILLVKRRDFRWLAICIATQVILVGIRYVETSSADLRATLVLAPLLFVEWWWTHLALPPDVKAAIGGAIGHWPGAVRWPAIFAICLIHRFHLGILILSYLVFRCGFAGRCPRIHAFDLLTVLILLCCVAGFVLFPIDPHPGWVWNVSMHVWALVSALVFALMGPALCDVVRRLLRQRKAVIAGVSVLCLVGLAHNTFALRREALWGTRVSAGVVSEGFYDCCRFIESSTPPDAVVLQPKFLEHIFVSLLTQRRSVLDYAYAYGPWCDTTPIISDLTEFYSGTSATTARDILVRYNVDYVIAETSDPAFPADDWHRPQASLMHMIFSSGDTSVYEVSATTEPASAIGRTVNETQAAWAQRY